MIIQRIELPAYDWYIKVYYAVDEYYADTILNELINLNCGVEDFHDAEVMFYNYKMNTGITYTNPDKHCTLTVIGLTTTVKEFDNTFEHEKGHIVADIAKYYNINPFGEEIQYLNGEISSNMFDIAKHFLCEHCRKQLSPSI